MTEGHAEAELFADEIAEAFAGDDAHARAHLLHDDQRERDRDHGPEQRVAELRACLGVGEDAAGVVIDVGRDEAGAKHREEDRMSRVFHLRHMVLTVSCCTKKS